MVAAKKTSILTQFTDQVNAATPNNWPTLREDILTHVRNSNVNDSSKIKIEQSFMEAKNRNAFWKVFFNSMMKMEGLGAI